MNKLLRPFLQILGKRGQRWVFASVFASFALVGVEIALAGVLQLLLWSLGLIPKDAFSSPTLTWLMDNISPAVMLIAIGMLRAIAQLIQGHGNYLIREIVLRRLRLLLIDRMLGQPGGAFEGTAVIQTRLGETFPKASLCGFYLLNTVLSAVQSFGMAIAMFAISWRDALVAFAGISVIGFTTRYSSKILRRVSGTMPMVQLRLQEGLVAVARNWLLVRIMRTEEQEHRRLAREIDSYGTLSESGAFWTNANGIIAPVLGIFMIVIILKVSQDVWSTPGTLVVAFLYMMIRFVTSLTQTVNAFSAVAMTYPQFRSAISFYNETASQPKRTGTVPVKVGGKSDITTPEIRFESVKFGFANRPVLFNSLTLDIKAGQQFGILGPSGSGKSTLLLLLLGILRPNSGRVLLGNRDAESVFESRDVRIGYVGPDPLLMAGTIRENLLYGLTEPLSDEKLWSALEKVRLAAHFRALPHQLDESLNEHADTLSAGQKQRLALARALAADPSLLILDEASANLDEGTEAEIIEVIRGLRGTTTTVIVSHRTAFLAHADQLIKLSHTATY